METDEFSCIQSEQVPTRTLTADFAQKGHMWIDRLRPGSQSKKIIILIRHNDEIVFSVDQGRHWIFEDAVLATGPNIRTLRLRFHALWPRWLNRQPGRLLSTIRKTSSAYNWRFANK